MAQPATPRRRQNKSCDQCRLGKRRCDVQVSIQRVHEADPLDFRPCGDHETSNLFASSPCSNCKKWKKRCTVDWIRSHQTRQFTPSMRPRKAKPAVYTTEKPTDEEACTDWYSHLAPEDVENATCDRLSNSISNDSGLDGSNSGSMNSWFNNFSHRQHDEPTSLINSQTYQSSYHFTPLQPVEVTASNINESQHVLDQDVLTGNQFLSGYHSNSFDFVSKPLSNQQSEAEPQVHERAAENPSYPQFSYGNELINKTPSPFASHILAEDHNRLYIKKGLLKIYHDSLEGALGCWLIERNCPYASSPFVDGGDAWSSKWSNRVVTRVRALDETYSRIGLLSQHDQKQASTVLSLVVMAFAVQWAQSAFGKHDDLHAQLPEHGIFGRNMQKELWHKANMALSQATSNTSFKIIFAGIVFSLIQRPMDSAEVLPNPGTKRQTDLGSLQKILDTDSGPIFLDVAVRKLHDHQRRLKDAESSRNGGPVGLRASEGLGEQDKETFGLVFWLAIMFDTISAAMNRRSFVLSDGETKIDDERPKHALGVPFSLNKSTCDLDGFSTLSDINNSHLDQESQIWGNFFLRQQSRIGDFRKQTTRWPCSYDDAAACLADAAPVKVLVFRRLGHLQDLYYQRAPAEAIEGAITATLEVYNHWKDTYGLFIGDCVTNHEQIPIRIQSWYILLASHWHLAIILLADLLEKLDDLNMTLPVNRITRQTTDFAQTLRLRSVYAVSDLGRCSRFGEDLSFSRSTDFHHAVNKAPLLTEPWTVVLVRSFAHAGEALVKLILSRRRAGFVMDAVNLAEARSRLDDCIEALWLLSRKSDMALSAAKILQETLDQSLILFQ